MSLDIKIATPEHCTPFQSIAGSKLISAPITLVTGAIETVVRALIFALIKTTHFFFPVGYSNWVNENLLGPSYAALCTTMLATLGAGVGCYVAFTGSIPAHETINNMQEGLIEFLISSKVENLMNLHINGFDELQLNLGSANES